MNGFQDRRARATNNELLNTKLTPPRLGTALVSRGLLLARLDAGLERPLTVLSAPAGFGKTTLAGEWIAAHAAQADLLAAWVALDESDNDPQRFWRYVITACRAFDGAPGRSALAALRASQTPALENVLVSFINELARLPTRSVLVLDDYHLITSPEIHETLSFLLDHFPAPLHLILITRSEPPLPLARLRARNQLNELDAADLRFSFDEMRLFFQQVARLPLSIEVLTRLEARTEGWAAGLRLIALALEGRSDQSAVEQFLTTFSGGHKHILEYLLNEVLINQPEPLQMFLLQTSFLNRLTGALCAAVTGRSDSSILLEQLARVNLFLIPLGSEGNQAWYRYHPLFAEAMQQSARTQLGEAAIQALLAKASEWHEAHAGLPDAIETALAARQFDRAGQLIERLVEQRGFNELYTLRRWAEQLPVDVLQAHPIVCFNLAMALLFTSDRTVPATAERVEQPLHMAGDVWRQAEDPHQ